MQRFESVACHLELAISSGKFEITEHEQSSVVEYFSAEFTCSFTRSAFLPGCGYKNSKTSNLLRFFNFS